MEVLCETVGPFAENSYFLVDLSTREAIAIDPGDEPDRLMEVVRSRDLKVRYILNTHAHIDHVGAVDALQRATGAPFHLHRDELDLLRAVPAQAAMFGLDAPPVPEVTAYLEEGQTFQVGGLPLISVVETPGHSPGHVSFVVGKIVISGDALFQRSIGRTDLPGGDHELLLRSIRTKLLTLPDETKVYPGHGDPTTIGEERRWNPFLME